MRGIVKRKSVVTVNKLVCVITLNRVRIYCATSYRETNIVVLGQCAHKSY